MEGRLEPFLRFSEGNVTQDGMRIKLRVETANVPPLDMEFHYAEVANMVQYLAKLASVASERRGPPKTFGTGAVDVAPIPATQLALMLGAPGKANLVVRLSDFDLAFELPLGALQSAAPSFAQTVETLAAEPKTKN